MSFVPACTALHNSLSRHVLQAWNMHCCMHAVAMVLCLVCIHNLPESCAHVYAGLAAIHDHCAQSLLLAVVVTVRNAPAIQLVSDLRFEFSTAHINLTVVSVLNSAPGHHRLEPLCW